MYQEQSIMNMKPIYVMMSLCIFVCSSCAESINVIDSTGRFVSVETPVNKVVSLGTGMCLGAPDQVDGRRFPVQ
jgi:ABC-type Fe3+-hydroxamate transport system substrate-binding protein